MMHLVIVRPHDPIEDHRFVRRLLQLGVSPSDIDRASIDVADSSILAAVARDGVLDQADRLPLPLERGGCADEILRNATQQLRSARAALQAPTVERITTSFWQLALTLRDVEHPTPGCDPLADSSAAAFAEYRLAARELVQSVPQTLTLAVDSPRFLLSDLVSATTLAAAHAGLGAVSVSLSGGEPKCEWTAHIPYLNITWNSGACVMTQSTFTLSRSMP